MPDQEKRYGTIITAEGVNRIAACIANGEKIRITQAAAGDGGGGYYLPTVDQTELKGEKWRGQIVYASLNETAPNMLDVKVVIDESVGNFVCREMGLYSEDGALIAVCNTPDTEKVSTSAGVDGRFTMLMHIVVADASVLEFSIAPSLDIVNREDLDKAVSDHNEDPVSHEDIRQAITKGNDNLQNQIADLYAALKDTTVANITIPTTGWGSANGKEDYHYSIDIKMEAATPDQLPIAIASLPDWLCPSIETLDGVLRFWAKRIPTTSMTFPVMLHGDGSIPKRLLYCAEEKGLLFNVYSDGDIQPAGETNPDSSVRTFENITIADNGGASLDTRNLPHLDIGISDIPGYSKGVKVSWSGANNDTGFPAIRVRLQEPTNEDAVGFTICSKREAALPIIVTLYACSSSLGTSVKEYGQYSVTLPNDGIAHHLRIPFSRFGITDGISLPGNASAVCFRISWNNAQSTDANGDMVWIDNVGFFSAEI